MVALTPHESRCKPTEGTSFLTSSVCWYRAKWRPVISGMKNDRRAYMGAV